MVKHRLILVKHRLIFLWGLLSFILSFVHNHSTRTYCPHWFISFIWTRLFDKSVSSSFIFSFFCLRSFNQNIRVLIDLFLLFVHDHSTKLYGSVSFIYLFCARPFDQDLLSPLIYFFYLHTTIRQKCIVLFHFFFLLFMIIQPKLGSSLIYFFYLSTTIRPNYMVLFHLFISFVHDYSTQN